MSKEEIEQLKNSVSVLMEKINALELKTNSQEVSKNIVERLEKGSDYHIIDFHEKKNQSTYSYTDSQEEFDDNNYEILNYFHTKEEAMKYSEHLLLSLKILRARDKVNNDIPKISQEQDNTPCLTVKQDGIIRNLGSSIYKEILSFKSEEARDNFRKLISDEEIIKFLSF